MNKEVGAPEPRVKKVRLEKFNNDKHGNPIREDGPVEVWEGTDESDMKCIFKKEEGEC